MDWNSTEPCDETGVVLWWDRIDSHQVELQQRSGSKLRLRIWAEQGRGHLIADVLVLGGVAATTSPNRIASMAKFTEHLIAGERSSLESNQVLTPHFPAEHCCAMSDRSPTDRRR